MKRPKGKEGRGARRKEGVEYVVTGLSGSGQPVQVHLSVKDPDVAEDVVHYVKTLEANRQIAPEGTELASGVTHQVETDTQGVKRLARRRFSAL